MKTPGFSSGFPALPFLSGFIGVLVLGTGAGVVVLGGTSTPASFPTATPSAGPSDEDLLRLVASRKQRIKTLTEEVARLETDAREYFSKFARSGIEEAIATEEASTRQNPFLTNTALRVRIKSLLLEERKREELAKVAQQADLEADLTERQVTLEEGQRAQVEEVFVNWLVALQAFRYNLPKTPQEEKVEGFRRVEESLRREMKGVLTAAQFDMWSETIGRKYHRYTEFAETAERMRNQPARTGGD